MPRWLFLVILGFVAYIAWRKYGGKLTGVVTNLTK